jgi:SAM-dependent methyltransferase
MDRRTAEVYARHAGEWIAVRGVNAEGRRRVRAFAAALPPGARVADLGCGPGCYAELLRRAGLRVVGLDLTAAMLRRRGAARAASRWCAPISRGRCRAGIARRRVRAQQLLPPSGARAAQAFAAAAPPLRPGAHLLVSVAFFRRENELDDAATLRGVRSHERFPGRLFVVGGERAWVDLLHGAGFSRVRAMPEPGERTALWLAARRFRGLPDSVRPRLKLLVCGLNPSPLAAESGVPFVGQQSLWPAALRAVFVARAAISHTPCGAASASPIS